MPSCLCPIIPIAPLLRVYRSSKEHCLLYMLHLCEALHSLLALSSGSLPCLLLIKGSQFACFKTCTVQRRIHTTAAGAAAGSRESGRRSGSSPVSAAQQEESWACAAFPALSPHSCPAHAAPTHLHKEASALRTLVFSAAMHCGIILLCSRPRLHSARQFSYIDDRSHKWWTGCLVQSQPGVQVQWSAWKTMNLHAQDVHAQDGLCLPSSDAHQLAEVIGKGCHLARSCTGFLHVAWICSCYHLH